MRARTRAAQPHSGHAAVAAWIRRREGRGLRTTLATQNVDDLHERAGTPDVQHLHGRLDVTSCLDCSFRLAGDTTAHETVPSCPRCSGPLRPGLVLFGEPPDLDASAAARRAVRQCRVYLAVGTSGVVSTSTGLLRYAGDVGAVRIAVDPRGEMDTRYDVHVRGTAATALPLLLAS